MNNKGFTIAQLLIALLIMGTVLLFAMKSYSGKSETAVHTGIEQSQKAKELEGKLFMASIINAEKTHFALNNNYAYTDWTANSPELGLSSSGNTYFKKFAVQKTPSGGFIVKVRGSGELEGVELVSEEN